MVQNRNRDSNASRYYDEQNRNDGNRRNENQNRGLIWNRMEVDFNLFIFIKDKII